MKSPQEILVERMARVEQKLAIFNSKVNSLIAIENAKLPKGINLHIEESK